jgi:FtsH-binding integral membrane protein
MNGYISGEQNVGSAVIQVELRSLFTQVYLWMGLGLLVTAIVSLVTASNEAALQGLMGDNFYLLFIVELVLVVAISAGLKRMPVSLAIAMFIVYAAVNGFTLAVVFLVFDLGMIVAAFLSVAAVFGAMAAMAHTTQLDLARYSTYFLMGLIGLLVALVVNLFLASGTVSFVISLFGVVLFAGLTAYDVQKIKQLAADPQFQGNSDQSRRLSIYGALILYLDFINLFLHLLSLGGDD